jgi:hypothetical protein
MDTDTIISMSSDINTTLLSTVTPNNAGGYDLLSANSTYIPDLLIIRNYPLEVD